MGGQEKRGLDEHHRKKGTCQGGTKRGYTVVKTLKKKLQKQRGKSQRGVEEERGEGPDVNSREKDRP